MEDLLTSGSRAVPRAVLDWSWVRSQLKPTKKLTHWIIYDVGRQSSSDLDSITDRDCEQCCFAGNAIFAGTKDKRKEPLFPVNGAVVHSFCAVGAALKKKVKIGTLQAETGATSFSKVTLEALRVLRSKQTPCDIGDVWRTISQLKQFSEMLGTSEALQGLTDDQILELVFRDDEISDKLFKKEFRNMKTPFYNVDGLPAGDKEGLIQVSGDGNIEIVGIGFR
jgi:hypothetical protein